jgi:hypothetical protein
MKTLNVVQKAVGLNIKELYTLEGILAIEDRDLLTEEDNFAGIYWVNKTARLFTINKEEFKSFQIN